MAATGLAAEQLCATSYVHKGTEANNSYGSCARICSPSELAKGLAYFTPPEFYRESPTSRALRHGNGELLEDILSYMPVDDRARVAQVCRGFRWAVSRVPVRISDLRLVLEHCRGALSCEGWIAGGHVIDPSHEQTMDRFRTAVSFLQRVKKQDQLNTSLTSYEMKAQLEQWVARYQGRNFYIPNGVFIAAMILLQFCPKGLWSPFEGPDICGRINTQSFLARLADPT
mmetsp:Transcript_218/g.439  ORF Transcript_218/g.439 Transcript_218/m.439 type:complete len:228 (-) Transcript_218:731-1414(-)|eukprot:CAMPEP_0184660428 /NCGR_PEP_ID=MMETSP0308-20130426/33880_1 /TAXON_ID=38269 /ORGANISM="Gloeochaete witrockiana, Strain SAG 46.84" /LENGTH=227 /DNA_ID=CAMNT_0027101007 /DNA_START=149 /DNA_END=832 /DNA_ORIENTATION=+